MAQTRRVVLVTGASGFIGRRLIGRLLEDGAQVHAVSRAQAAGNDHNVHWWQADLTDGAAADGLVNDISPEIVFHLASLVTGNRDISLVLPALEANLVAGVNLMTAISRKGCNRLVLAGSMEEPDPAQGTLIPSSPYAAAKWACSGYAQMFHALYHTPISTARIFMVYGPGQIDLKKLVPYVTLCLLRGEKPNLMSGERQIDWIYVDDVVDGLIALATHAHALGRRLDLGSGQLVKVREVVETLCRISGTGIQAEFSAMPDRALEQTRIADPIGTETAIGWAPRWDLEEGLRETYRWYARELKEGRIEA